MSSPSLTISRLAATAQVHVETVRYYQRRGLLPEPKRSLGGIRRYGPIEISRLQFIRQAQAMGFSLEEIAGLIEVKGQQACERTRLLTEHKLADVRRRLAELQQLEQDLVALVLECGQAPGGECCPTLDRLERAEIATSPSRTRASGKQARSAAHRRLGQR